MFGVGGSSLGHFEEMGDVDLLDGDDVLATLETLCNALVGHNDLAMEGSLSDASLELKMSLSTDDATLGIASVNVEVDLSDAIGVASLYILALSCV